MSQGWSPYGQSQQVPVKQGGNKSGLILGIIIVALIGFIYAHQAGLIAPKQIENDKKVPDKQTVVDPIDDQVDDSTPSNNVSIEDTYVVRVYESSAEKPMWLTKQIRNEQFWIAWVADQGMDLHTLDPINREGEANPQAASFVKAAKERDIEPPFWMHVKQGGSVLSITPFEDGVDEDAWKQVIENSVKD